MQNRDHADELAVLRQDLAGDGFEGVRPSRVRVGQRDVAAIAHRLAREQQVGDERGEVRVVRADAEHGVFGRALGRREEPLRGVVHHDDRAADVGHQDRIGDGVDDQVEAIALHAHLAFRRAQAPVVLFDLLGGAAEIGDVSQDRDHAGAVRRVGDDGADKLQEEVGAFVRIDEEQLATQRLRRGCAPRERRREEHVVQRDGALPAFALAFLGREEPLGRAVRDQHPPLGVREENGVRHGVDDGLQEIAIAVEPALVLDVATVRAQVRHARAEDIRDPARLAHHARQHRTDEEDAEARLLVDDGTVERNREIRHLRNADRFGVTVLRDDGRLQAREDADEGMVPLLELDPEGRRIEAPEPMTREADEGRVAGVDGHAQGMADAGVGGQPLHRPLRTLCHVVRGEEKLQELEPLFA